jgi:hypothetical protein
VKKKSIIIVIALLVILSTLCYTIKIKQDKCNQLSEYTSNVHLIKSKMISSVASSTELLWLTADAWWNNIFEIRDVETDLYTLTKNSSFHNPKFNNNVNVTFNNIFLNDINKERINKIITNKKEVDKLMMLVQNPPNEYKESYNLLLKLYEAYKNLTNTAITQPNDTSFKLFIINNTTNIVKFNERYTRLDEQLQ